MYLPIMKYDNWDSDLIDLRLLQDAINSTHKLRNTTNNPECLLSVTFIVSSSPVCPPFEPEILPV